MLADYKNDLANLLRESFGVDVKAKPEHTKSRILLRLIWLHTLLVLGCLRLLNSMEKILGVLLSILVSILPNKRVESAFIFFILNWNRFLMVFIFGT